MIDNELNQVITAWTEGDTKTLENTLLSSFEEYPQIYNKFLTDRNRLWCLKVETLLNQKETVLIVVGVGHLIGKNSLIQLLRGKGFSVKQL